MAKQQTKTAQKEQSEDQLKELYKEYDLTPADIFKHKNFLIITRQGFQKIMGKADIQFDFEQIGQATTILPEGESESNTKNYDDGRSMTMSESSNSSSLFHEVAYKGKFWKKADPDNWVVSNGSANTRTVPDHMGYYHEMALKRLVARGVLTLLGLYQQGIYSEEEADDFGKAAAAHRKKQA